MEQEPKQKFGPGLWGVVSASAFLGACLALSLWTGSPGEASPAAAVSAAALFEAPSQSVVHTSVPVEGKTVIPIGKAVGIKLFSDGVLVVGLSPVETEEGSCYPGRDCGLKEGDVITHINGEEVDTIEQVQAVVAQQRDTPLTIQAVRGQQQLQLTVEAAENSQGNYQLGIWLRDSMAGIGTMTFYDPDSGMFAALGHGINDVDTAMLMPLESGSIMPASVSDVKKGESGSPGELHGQFDLKKDLGTLYANTELGIFGQMPLENLETTQQPVPVASREQVEVGHATILSNVRDDQVEEFDIEITKVYSTQENTRNLMIQVTDPELLALTGGIVQGMSGSPILQNGRLVGAVTHVLVNDSTRGYGILAENMFRQATGSQAQAS